MSRLVRTACAFILVCCAVPPSALPARAAVEVIPFMGVYHPLDEMQNVSGQLVIQVTSGPMYGGRAAWWINPRFALEASVGLTPTETVFFGAFSGTNFESPGTMLEISERVRFRVTAAESPNQIDLVAGFGMTDLRHSVDDPLGAGGIESDPVLSGIVGLGVTISVLKHASLRLEFEDFMHENIIEVTVAGSGINNRLQHDLAFTFGVVLPIGKAPAPAKTK